ncbi:hypothetical protein NXH64_08740 [Butyrivibrio fibrisolvens]|uniref:hypothetical protein n=1 Tax=Pseudobutyrivibrio ruminis TaxID=46206 RepID=UPI00041F9BC9|nr:hypothetical protein [Pseudobutyrivibrio ruminis]MDC7279586.1 hypothetical protein [Butyrivibrio fibrisolvens]
MDVREVLNSIDKEDLINLIINYSDGGYYPLDLFTLAAMEHAFSVEELEAGWEHVVDQANAYEDDDNPKAADLLGDAAALFFKQAKRLDKKAAKAFMQRMVDDLTDAAEVDGVGMSRDAEWIYLQVRDEIEEWMR